MPDRSPTTPGAARAARQYHAKALLYALTGNFDAPDGKSVLFETRGYLLEAKNPAAGVGFAER